MARKKSKEELVREFARKRVIWKNNPTLFFEEVLGIKLPHHQKEIIKMYCRRADDFDLHAYGKSALRRGVQ